MSSAPARKLESPYHSIVEEDDELTLEERTQESDWSDLTPEQVAYLKEACAQIDGDREKGLLIPASYLVRRPPVVLETDPPAPGVATPLTAVVETRMGAAEALRTPQFAALALAHFACCAAHSGPIFHMVTYAIGCGIGAMAAVSVYSLAGLSGLAGRILLGITADRVGARPTLVAGLLVQAMGAGAYVFVSDLGAFYALSIVFGIAYGGVMPLYAILVRDYFGPRVMGTVFGAVSMAASLGMALGPWAGGHLFDSFGGYGWLHIGSFAIGLGAVAIALSFRPIRVAPPPPPAAAPA